MQSQWRTPDTLDKVMASGGAIVGELVVVFTLVVGDVDVVRIS